MQTDVVNFIRMISYVHICHISVIKRNRSVDEVDCYKNVGTQFMSWFMIMGLHFKRIDRQILRSLNMILSNGCEIHLQ